MPKPKNDPPKGRYVQVGLARMHYLEYGNRAGSVVVFLPEFGPRMKELVCPLLTFWGRQDQYMPPRGKAQCIEANETSRFIEANACGHWVMIEHARMFNATSLDFLANGYG